jgi:hypothetical protein
MKVTIGRRKRSADHHHRASLEACHAADDGLVVGIGTVAVQLLELGEDHLQVVEGVGTLRVARELRHLPWT